MDRVEIKKKAKEFAFKNKWNIWKPIIIIGVISGVIGGILGAVGLGPELVETADGMLEYEYTTAGSIAQIIVDILLLPMSVGGMYYLIKLIRGEEFEINDLFSKYKYILPIIVIVFLVGLFTALWTLLLIIPGIIYAFKVAMVPYLMADELDESTGYMDLINKSKEMMDGHKWEYFKFDLSFIGWILLCGITLGIAAIWVVPYIQTANVMYFEELKKLNNK